MFSWGKKDNDSNSDGKKLTKEDQEKIKDMFKPPSDSDKKDWGMFDPTGFERAAKAARELEEFKYAKDAINIALQQEKTKRVESQQKIEENRAKQKEFEVVKTRVQEEERRKTIETDAQARQQNAYYQDQLARKRNDDHMAQQRAMRDEGIRKQEESQQRIEALRRQTAEYEANIRKQTETARAEAEARGRIEQERKNWDLHMQRSRLEQQELRKTVLEGIKEAGTMVGNGISGYLNDREKLATTIGLVSLLALGIYGARVSTRVVGNILEARLSQPPLIRETSRISPTNLISHPIRTVRNKLSTFQSATDPNAVMQDIILENSVKERLEKFVVSTGNTLKNRAPFRNMLLHGPPGTGKTLFAKQLAQKVNMNYAIMTGSDVLPLGRNAVTEIHKLFDWAEKSSKGLVLFVDEAETFLRKRNDPATGLMSEETRNALNAFLARTGTGSKKFMVIFATNQPTLLDNAINDRTDEMVPFNLPGEIERFDILKLYFDKLIVNGHLESKGMFGGPSPIAIDPVVTDSLLQGYAAKLKNFSGRELNKLVVAWQAEARGNLECFLAKSEMDKIVEQRLAQHKQREEWETK